MTAADEEDWGTIPQTFSPLYMARVEELIAAATQLRQAQRNYLLDPQGQRDDHRGKLVGEAAERVDEALMAFTVSPNFLLRD